MPSLEWSQLWEVWGKVVCDEEIHDDQRAFIVADTVGDALKGYEVWAKEMWKDTVRVEVIVTKRTHSSVVMLREERCRCPVGFGQVAAEDCPRHNPKPSHTISGVTT